MKEIMKDMEVKIMEVDQEITELMNLLINFIIMYKAKSKLHNF